MIRGQLTLDPHDRGRVREASPLRAPGGFVSSFIYIRMGRREEKIRHLEKCKQLITVHRKQVSFPLQKKHFKVLTS